MSQDTSEMTVAEAHASMASGDAVILDVREPIEWTAGHVDGAVHVPLAQVPARLAEVPEAATVAVICRSGNRSRVAVDVLRASGRAARNVSGGMQAWQSAGLPFVSSDGSPATVA